MKKVIKQFISLFTGTALSQLIPFLTTPILSRIYEPKDFGIYASYIAVITILFVLCTARYELAIIASEGDKEGETLLFGTIMIALIFNVILSILIFLFGDSILKYLGLNEIIRWMYLVPFSLIFMAVFQSVYFMLNKKEYYKVMSISLIIQSMSIAVSNIIIGLYSENGLIVGYVIGQFISMILVVAIVFKYKLLTRKNFSLSDLIFVLKKYINFPKFLIISNLANRGALQSTIIVFTNFYNSSNVGHYSLTHRILKTPISFIGNSISQIFRQKASVEIAEKGNCKKLYIYTFISLFVIGIIPFSILFIWSREIFIIFLGESWAKAGDYAKLLTPMLFAQFCIAPLSSMFLLDNKQKLDLIWQLMALIVSLVVLIGCKYLYNDIEISIFYYSITYVLLYLINLILSYNVARGSEN